MLTENREHIYLLKNFTIDKTLRKYEHENFSTNSKNNFTLNEGDVSEFNSSISFGTPENFDNDTNSKNWNRVWDGIPFKQQRYYSSRWEKNWFLMKMKLKMIFVKKGQSPVIYFKNIKESIEELTNIEDKILYLDNLSDILRSSKQTKMLNIALVKKGILEYEKILKESGFKKFITEENLISFTLKCKKVLCLNYVNEFDRIIPLSVIENKNKADELKVFDNFVILHYDPNIKKVNLVEKKDPILFGLIKNSDKLYFVDDWIDEKCDLTYDKIIKELNIDEELC